MRNIGIQKVTVGFVAQTFDPETLECIGQEFFAGSSTWEDENGENIRKPNNVVVPHLDMVQPVEEEDKTIRFKIRDGIIKDVSLGSKVKHLVNVVSLNYDLNSDAKVDKDEDGTPCMIVPW